MIFAQYMLVSFQSIQKKIMKIFIKIVNFKDQFLKQINLGEKGKFSNLKCKQHSMPSVKLS